MWNRQDYHLLVANNFLRNISHDGSHEDTALRIFNRPGLPADYFRRWESVEQKKQVKFEAEAEVLDSGRSSSEPPFLPANHSFPSILIDNADGDDEPTPLVPLLPLTHRHRGGDSECEAQGGDEFDPLSQSLNFPPKKGHRGGDSECEAQGGDEFDPLSQSLNFPPKKGEGGGRKWSLSMGSGKNKKYKRQKSTGSDVSSQSSPPLLSREEPAPRKWSLRKSASPVRSSSAAPKGTILGKVSNFVERKDRGKSVEKSADANFEANYRSLPAGGKPEIRILSSFKSFSLRNDREEGCRHVLLSGMAVPCFLFSIVPYARTTSHHLKGSVDMSRTRHSSSSSASGLRPFDMDPEEEISYARLISGAGKVSESSLSASSRLQLGPPLSPASLTRHSFQFEEPGIGDNESVDEADGKAVIQYDPDVLEDPLFGPSEHKTTIAFPGYMTTIVDYVDPSELKKEVNEKFRERYPHITITLSKIRSLKREMREIALDSDMDLVTLAQAYVYFERVIFKGLVNKPNRKIVAGACMVLAAKLNDFKGTALATLMENVESQLRVGKKELIPFELPITIALEFGLHIPESYVLPHYQRLLHGPV